MEGETELTQFFVAPIDSSAIIFAEPGERAYSLKSKRIATDCSSSETEAAAPDDDANVLGYEAYTAIGLQPFLVETDTADKRLNERYTMGCHAPGGVMYQERSKFKPGEKVLCITNKGIDAVIPAIVIGPLSKLYLHEIYENNERAKLHCTSLEQSLDNFTDWAWDAIVVRPLVRITNSWEPMGETIWVPRVYLFPFKRFQVGG